jgi:NAD(P)-dependent dehydrogenase (short-subunit alcohol dehydrogenase family)
MQESWDVVLLTGATGVIGHEIAVSLAAVPSLEVVLGGRDERKVSAEVERVRSQTGGRVRGLTFDVSSKADITRIKEAWEGPLHALINNASVAPRERTTTKEGLETIFATNVMGYVWMMEAFAPLLSASRPSRVVNVASHWAGDLDEGDLQFETRSYDNNQAYRQSKAAERMLTVAYAERFAPLGISVNACHPGDVPSNVSTALGFGGSMSAQAAAETPVWLVTDESGKRETGKYFAARALAACEFARDPARIERLYQVCQRFA